MPSMYFCPAEHNFGTVTTLYTCMKATPQGKIMCHSFFVLEKYMTHLCTIFWWKGTEQNRETVKVTFLFSCHHPNIPRSSLCTGSVSTKPRHKPFYLLAVTLVAQYKPTTSNAVYPFWFTLGTIWHLPLFWIWKYMIMNIKQKKIPDCYLILS